MQDLERINAELQGTEVTTDVDAMQAQDNAAVLTSGSVGAESLAAADVQSGVQSSVQVRSVVFLNEESASVYSDELLAEVSPVESDALVTTDTAASDMSSAVSFVSPKAAAAVSGTEMQADGWLNQLPNDAFVVQLAKGANEKGIQKFVRRHGLEDQAAYYRTERESGQVVFVLITSPFSTVADAKAAVAEMPVAVQKGIWVRNVSTLQDLYRQPGSGA
ncbi:SPOR domain-containing protein [Aliamphritea spongicola]|nr:SPOR domain-containing protein [Aliamphritea spongicola]